MNSSGIKTWVDRYSSDIWQKEKENRRNQETGLNTVIYSPRSHVFEGIAGKYVPLRISRELEWYYYIILSKRANLSMLRSH